MAVNCNLLLVRRTTCWRPN